MPVAGGGWELHIVRDREQRTADGRRRTVGRYQVFHDRAPQPDPDLYGATAEAGGPGANRPKNNGLRIEAARYPLWTQSGDDYVTWEYTLHDDWRITPKPGLALGGTGERTEILIHPGHGFLASVGCINLCTSLPSAGEEITFLSSRRRVIAVIEDLKQFVGPAFPKRNGEPIPNASVVIDREP